MKIENLSAFNETSFVNLKLYLSKHKTLGQVLTWANSLPKENFCKTTVAEVITQDEYTHDVIVPYQDIFLVYDTT